jgi:2-dehydro-3-deoxyphosphogluconate aldolase/(4S)-4-hydroxy-2-oxoglutarate aldolase
MSTLSTILSNKIIAIIRGADPADVLKIAEALCEGGVRCLEITLNSTDALQLIESLATKMDGSITVGAGTVLNAKAVHDAVSAGAKFIISPMLDVEVIHKTKDLGAVSIPGAYTPTEIFSAFSNGGDLIKVFPSSGGPSFIREVLAPFPYIPLMPTGGINLTNIGDFKNAGAVAFGMGKSLVDTRQKATPEYLQQITANAKKFIAAIS